MSPTLPFDTFLEVLRGKGYSVGLPEHFALAKILERWDRTDSAELGDAIAALVGRTGEEVVAVRGLFDEICGDLGPPPPPPPPPLPPRPWWRAQGRWFVAVAVVAVLLTAVLWQVDWRPPQKPVGPPTTRVPPPPPPALDAVIAPEPPTPLPLPTPPSKVVRRVVLLAGFTCFFVGLAWAWWAKTRAVARRWLRDAWRAALGALPGPYQFIVRVRGLATRLPRLDVEDAAVILGRIFSSDARARDLDVKESLRLTLSRGLVPHLVFQRVRTARPIVVLQDICYDMEPWRRKVEGLLFDLRRQGVALERWYFDGDIRRLSEKPRGAWMSLAGVIGRRSDSPVMVLSTGAGLAAVNAEDAGWQRALESRQRRTWITPLADSRLWPDELSSVSTNVWPMTRGGLTHAARELAGVEVVDTIRTQVLEEVRVTRDDIERVKRLASLVPHPTTDLLELLRERFTPDVPDAVIAHIARAADASGMRVIRLDDDEVRRHTAAVRLETPRLEALVRRQILTVLEDSQPATGSASHLRWRLAVALQKLSLAQLQQGQADESHRTLRELEHGPLWEEVRAAARLAPVTPGSTAGDGGTRAWRETPPADNGQLSEWMIRPRTWPGLKEIAAATVAALVIVAAARWLGALPATTLAHVTNAYELSLASGSPVTGIELRRVNSTSPATVGIFQDGMLFQDGVTIPNAGAASVNVAGNTGRYYEARAVLRPDGNLAVSNQLWVPDANMVTVIIDAQPWARFTIEGTIQGETVGIAPQLTPVRVALKPGDYLLRFENAGLTPILETKIAVTPSDSNRTFSFTMPDFKPAQAVTDLMGR